MKRLAILTAAFALSLSAVAFADDAAPIAPDSPEANGGASPTTLGKGITNDGSSAAISATPPAQASAPSSGTLGADDPAVTDESTSSVEKGDRLAKPKHKDGDGNAE